VNSTYEALKGMKVTAKIYNLDAKEEASKGATLDVPADSSTKAFDLPAPDGLTATYFVKLQLRDAAGKLVSDNFYWLSTKVDTLDWAKRNDTDYTPQKEFADLTALNDLPKQNVVVSSGALTKIGQSSLITLSITNKGSGVAFLVHLRLTRGKSGDDVVPVFWNDNYFSLLPSEKKTVTVKFDNSSLGLAEPQIVVEGWNVEVVKPTVVAIPPKSH
jgi:exo-1,4-beta-D-glucosaminidase